MKDFVSGSTSDASRRLQFETWPRWVGLLLLSVSFLVTISVACGDDQPSSLNFPRHDYPLGTDRGGEYFAGQLVLKDGCLRVEVPSDDANTPRWSQLLIWPSEYTVEEASGTVRVIDGLGRTAAQVGDYIRLSPATVTYEEAKLRELVTGLSERCVKPSFLVGDEVTVFDPENEAIELHLSDPDVLFLRQETAISANRGFQQAAGIGELVLDGQCLRLKGGATILWPAGFTPHVEGGAVQVRNGAGRTIASVGDEIAGGGGYFKSRHGECPGEMFRIHVVKVLPDVEVYFLKQDGAVAVDQRANRFVGTLVLNGKCLGVDDVVNLSNGSDVPGPVLLIWPGGFELMLEDGGIEIVNYRGHVAARLGDEVQFRALELTYNQALEHGGLDEITPACGAPYWAVGEEFTSAEYP